MSQQGGSQVRWERVGTGLAVLSVVIPLVILLGQALGYKLSPYRLHVLFWVGIAGVVIGFVLILVGIGPLRWLRNFQSPITLRSPVRDRPAQNAQAGSAPPVDWVAEYRKQQHEITTLQTELRVWGNDPTARKLLKLAMDEFPKLSVGFVKDLAGLFYAAHQQPRSDFEVEFKAVDENQTQGYVGVPALNRGVELPYGEAILVAGQLRQLIKKIQNESINEARRLGFGQSRPHFEVISTEWQCTPPLGATPVHDPRDCSIRLVLVNRGATGNAVVVIHYVGIGRAGNEYPTLECRALVPITPAGAYTEVTCHLGTILPLKNDLANPNVDIIQG